MGGVCSTNKKNAYRFLVGKSEGKTSLRRPRRRWGYNIKMDLNKNVWRAWTGLIWLRVRIVAILVNTIINLQLSQNARIS